MHAPPRPSLKSESGAMLIEIIVSIAVFALVALSVLAGIDSANRATGREKARSVAASLAEQDQERLRSLQIGTLSNSYDRTRTEDHDGVSYTIRSTAEWIQDSTAGAVTCTSNGQASYLKISSTVTSSTVGTRVSPVRIDSLLAPSVAYSSTRGTLAVQVNNRSAAGVANVPVTITGPTTMTQNTNASGCALFEYIPTGTYATTASVSGWVDRAGAASATASQVVTTGNLNLKTLSYDQAAMADVQVKTTYPGASSNGLFESAATTVSARNPEAAGVVRTFSPSGGTITATGLFPFLSQYAFYAGNCIENDPATAVNGNYFADYGGGLTTASGSSGTVVVREGPLGIQIWTRDSQRSNGVYSPPGSTYYGPGGNGTLVTSITATPVVTSGCTPPTYTLTTATNPNPPTGYTPGTGAADAGRQWVSASSTSYDPGLPYGKYKLCVTAKAPGLLGATYKRAFDYVNNLPNGPSTPTVIQVDNSVTTGC